MFLIHSPSLGFLEGIDVENNLHWTPDIHKAKPFSIVYHIALFIDDAGKENMPSDWRFGLASKFLKELGISH